MERIAMSQQDLDWLEWLKRAQDGVVTQRLAAEKLGVADRWVRSLLAEMKVKGDAVVIHGLRGRPSNRRIDEEVRARSMKILQSPDWHDFKSADSHARLVRVMLPSGVAVLPKATVLCACYSMKPHTPPGTPENGYEPSCRVTSTITPYRGILPGCSRFGTK
jgi:hypothetical protein